jgi:hypothetical protein
MLNEWWSGTDVEGSGHGVICGPVRNYLKKARRTLWNLIQNSWCRGWGSNRAPSEYRSHYSQLYPAWSVVPSVDAFQYCYFSISGYILWVETTKLLKCKVVPSNPMKAFRGKRGIAPLINYVGTRWKWVVCFTARPIYPRKNIRAPIE